MIRATRGLNAQAQGEGGGSPRRSGVAELPAFRLSRAMAKLERDAGSSTYARTLCETAVQVFAARVAALWVIEAPTEELVGIVSIDDQGAVNLPDDISLARATHPIVRSLAQPVAQQLDRSTTDQPWSFLSVAVDDVVTIPIRHSISNQALGVLAVGGLQEDIEVSDEMLGVATLMGRLAAKQLGQDALDAPPARSEVQTAATAVLDAMQDGVILISRSGGIVHVSPAAQELLSVRAEDIVGQQARDIAWQLTDEDGQHVPFERLPISLALRDRTIAHERDMQAGMPPRQRWVRLRARYVEPPGAGGGQVVLAIRDLTEHRELVEQLSGTERMRTVGQLASSAIHDINNWFGLILGQAELMLVADPPSELLEGMESIRKAACDGAEALKRIQDLARSPIDADPTPVDVNQILREVVDITRPRWSDLLQAHSGSTSVIMDLSVPLAPILVVPSELREVFTNLILNAVDAMPHGGTLRVSSKRKRNRIVVMIADSGTGMSEEVRSRIFEPFFTTKGARGSGLGLAVSKTMVERHGGRISVDSEPGRGTTFTLSFAPSEPAGDNVAWPDVPAPRPSRVLLVEDDPHMRDLLTRMLEHDRHTVTGCRSGREAIAALGREVFDIVLTDLVMPLVDGWDVAQATRKAHPLVPVVLITGTSQRFSEAELRARGVSARLNKPFRLDQLRRTMGNALGTEGPASSADARPRILAVDDEPAMTRMISAMLQTSGCEVQTANDGEDARLLMEEASRAGRPFGLLFTDMAMPNMDGGELIRQARLINPRIVTVLLSGNVAEGAAVGADLSLPKPYSLAALLQTLDRATALCKRVSASR